MKTFFKDNERSAFLYCHYRGIEQSVCLDLVQESMLQLLTKYQHLPSNEWRPIFYRILDNKIKDEYRRRAFKKVVFFWELPGEEAQYDMQIFDQTSNESATKLQQRLHDAITQLSEQQRQAFVLRQISGLSEKQTAEVMRTKVGTVKSHYHRAIKQLQGLLGENDANR